MNSRRPKVSRPAYLLFGACTFCYLLFFLCYEFELLSKSISYLAGASNTTTQLHPPPDHHTSLHLTTEQCEATFPGLTKDIQDTVALGPFEIHPSGNGGPLQVQIKEGQLYIFLPNRSEPLPPELLDAQTATLHLLHRALLTSPTPLPSTILTLNIHDQPFGTALSYARPAFRPPPSSSTTTHGPSLVRAFLMPHFSFWSWPLPSIGSISRAADAVTHIESAVPFAKKDGRLAWRGTTGWNSAHYPRQREELLRVAGGKEWADVQALRGYGLETTENRTTTQQQGKDDGNALMIEDFCRYKYVLYTEGVTYSGRLQFLQMCKSVLIAPPVAWLQHTTHMIRPVWSGDLYSEKGEEGWEPDEGVKEAWPVRYPPREANAVFVAPDWSDLRRTVEWLEGNPGVAEGIAGRQREVFVGEGYLSPAAEVCYWRALIRGWSEVVRYESAEWEGREVVSWEAFTLGHRDGKVG